MTLQKLTSALVALLVLVVALLVGIQVCANSARKQAERLVAHQGSYEADIALIGDMYLVHLDYANYTSLKVEEGHPDYPAFERISLETVHYGALDEPIARGHRRIHLSLRSHVSSWCISPADYLRITVDPRSIHTRLQPSSGRVF